PPPYPLLPWMGAGIPVLATLLLREGIRSRVVRLLDDPAGTPSDIVATCELTQWGERSLDERRAAMAIVAARHSDFFDRMVEVLLDGPENVFGLSTYRHNSDVALELARRLKERRPGCYVILGGPEAVEVPANLICDDIDLVVGAGAEALVSVVVRACL